MIIATLDTNVIVSGIIGYLRATSTPGALIRHIEDETFRLVISRHILKEVDRTLAQAYFTPRLMDIRVRTVRSSLNKRGFFVSITDTVQGIATHPEDDLVLATAVSGNADYLVTGDKGLLSVGTYQGVTIVTPRAFLDILETPTLPQEPV